MHTWRIQPFCLPLISPRKLGSWLKVEDSQLIISDRRLENGCNAKVAQSGVIVVVCSLVITSPIEHYMQHTSPNKIINHETFEWTVELTSTCTQNP